MNEIGSLEESGWSVWKGNEEESMTHFSKFATLIAIATATSFSSLGCNASTAEDDENVASAEGNVTAADEGANVDEKDVGDESVAMSDDVSDDAADDEANTAEDESALSTWGDGYGYRGYGYRGYGNHRYGRYYGHRGYGYGRYHRGFRGFRYGYPYRAYGYRHYRGYLGNCNGYGYYGCGGYGW